MILLYNAGIYSGFKGLSAVDSLKIPGDHVLAAGLKDELSSIAYPILISLRDTGANAQPAVVAF